MKNFLKSPFMYIAKSKIKLFNKKNQKSINYKKFDDLLIRDEIKDHYYDILRLLAEYRYLTVLTIDTFLKSSDNNFWTNFTDEERKKAINLSLKFLRDNGIVQHNVITWKPENTNNRLQTPNYYKLTKGGIACIKKLWELTININKYSIELPIHIVLKELAINQMIANYKLKVQHLENIILNKKIKNSKTKEWFNLRVVFTIKKDANIVQFVVEPVRRNNFWKKEITTKLSIFENIFKINKEKMDDELIKNPILVLLCEDVPHIKECFCILHEADLINETMFFTADSLQLSTELVSTLMKVQLNNEKLNLVEYEIDYLG